VEAYYANTIDVTMLRREQERIGVDLRAIESRQAVLDASLDDWQEVMDLKKEPAARSTHARIPLPSLRPGLPAVGSAKDREPRAG
jgi:hypothetical protein